MPTGYTAPVADGERTELRDFALDCTRAFLGEFREVSSEQALTTTEFPVPTHYAEKQAEAEARLKEVEGWDDEQAGAEAEATVRQVNENNERWQRERVEKKERYEAMLDKVENWHPPKLYEPLKAYMLDQLRTSIDHDCAPLELPEPVLLAPARFREAMKETAQQDISYFREHAALEEKRAQDATNYIDGLRESLNGAS